MKLDTLSRARETLKYFLPPLVPSLAMYGIAIARYLARAKLVRNNAKLKNCYAGQSVHILGNGPSLNSLDMHSLSGQHVISMNHFELHPYKDKLNIVAHCIGEPFRSATWEDPTPMVSGVRAQTYWFSSDAADYFKNSKASNIHYYHPGVRADALWLDGADLSFVALNYQSTAQMAINVAMYMGFKEIYLHGLDHDWLVTRGFSPHFYAERDEVDKADLSKFTYTEMIRISLNLFKIYEKLRNTAERQEKLIVNLSTNSYLDVFPGR